jgi:hypothetical protein
MMEMRRREIPYERLEEDDYIGANITLLQSDILTPLRSGSTLPEGTAEAIAEYEQVLELGGPILEGLLRQVHLMLQYFNAEEGRARSDMNATISRKYEKKYRGMVPPELLEYEYEMKEEGR